MTIRERPTDSAVSFPPTATFSETLPVAGASIYVRGNRVVVGLPTASSNVGSVRVYQRTAGTWSFLTTLTATVPVVSGQFGQWVAVSGTQVVATSAGGTQTLYFKCLS